MIDLPSPALIGVVHLDPLPGSPRQFRSMEEIVRRALADGRALLQARFDALIVENFGDAPFPREHTSPASVAAVAIVADQMRRVCGLRIGINLLRNDARSALGVAAAAGGSFIRVNVHTGVCATDQGILEGKAGDTLRYRRLLGTKIAILADVHVKHATPLHEPDIGRAARDTAYRGLADGLIVTGTATGAPVDPADLKRVRRAVPDRRLFVGSGATASTVESLLKHADGIIVGSALKADGDPSNPIEPDLAKEFTRAAGRSS